MSESTRFYRHYKNKPYRYLGTVRHSETLEEMALYETLYENELGRMWVRPKAMFFEDIELNGKARPRFEKVQFRFQTEESVNDIYLHRLSEIYQQAFGQPLNEDILRSKIGAHSRTLLVMAFDSEKLVGFKLGYAQDQHQFYSWIGAVADDYRGLGLASEMMRVQHDWCAKHGFERIETRTRDSFSAMLSLNLKFGFRVVGLLHESPDSTKIILQKQLKSKN